MEINETLGFRAWGLVPVEGLGFQAHTYSLSCFDCRVVICIRRVRGIMSSVTILKPNCK